MNGNWMNMIRIIDTYPQIGTLFEGGVFQADRWSEYINAVYENSDSIFRQDLQETLNCGFSYERDVLPVIEAANNHPSLQVLHDSFLRVTDRLNERIAECFGHELDVDIVLYLGLCCGAGWVLEINGRRTILLGIEKILELKWYDLNSMYGLIYHELGHVYQMQYGLLEQHSGDGRQNFVWQLFTEGIAMYFEQTLVGDPDYYHQNVNGWRDWCDAHFDQIAADFYADLPTMTRENQRYFGDWVRYRGQGDVGYYLGSRFVRHLSGEYGWEALINMKIDEAYRLFLNFVQRAQSGSLPDKHSGL